MCLSPNELQEWWQTTSYKFRRMDYHNSDLGPYTREHEAQHQQQQMDATAQPAEAAIEQVEQTKIIKPCTKQ